MSNKMFDNGFDPYDELIRLQARLDTIEAAHNRLATDYIRSQQDLDLALSSIQSLQKGHLALSRLVGENPIFNMNLK